MDDRKTPPRLTVDITDEQKAGLDRIEWGMRKVLFHHIIDQLNLLMDKGDPTQVISAIVAGKLKLEDIV